MLWNGSFLGYIHKTQILHTVKFAGDIYWRLQVKDALYSTDTTIVCKARGAQNSFPCIIDQLKEICGIPKIGTHWVRMGKRIFILSRVDSDSQFDVLIYNKLSAFNKNIFLEFSADVKRIFAFKEAFGVKFATLNSIKIVKSEIKSDSEFAGWLPLSVKDTHFDLSKAIVKKPMIKLWFNNNIQEVVTEIHKLLDITPENYNKKIHALRSQIDKMILGVDKEAVSLSTALLERIDSFF
jgi:hypothetical protein